MEQARRTLHLITRAFAVTGIAMVVVLAIVDLGDAPDPDLAGGATLAAAAFGALGLLVALQWWSRAGETMKTPNNITIGFIIRVAIAETGLLMGILGLIMTGEISPAYVGLGFFLVALLLLDLGLRRTAR